MVTWNDSGPLVLEPKVGRPEHLLARLEKLLRDVGAEGVKLRGGSAVEEVEDADADGGEVGKDDNVEEGGVGVGEFGGEVEFVGCCANWEVGKRARRREED
ncbi:hypothetical protein C1H46_021528 [Malus baccata]|uniref:Uncharacterized protein n=1 Tax=Malus baccata TaxID=106549 RepID=A0A540M2D3_MALBA|nr:hypothetical protein C1H46_021528 [Malus baccata]